MNMLYHITNLCPRTDILMGRCGFSIQLFPAWKEAVKASKLTQQTVDTAIGKMHRLWLDGCGYNKMHDPDRSPTDEWKLKNMGIAPKLGPRAYHLYGSHDIRISWGEWGPEHITVPGDACGLDIDCGFHAPLGGMVLHPHNIDSLGQVVLLLVVFTFFAEGFVLDAQIKERS